MEKIGLQLYSIKELTRTDFIGTLKKWRKSVLEDSLDQVIEYSLDINGPYIICPELPLEMSNSIDAYKKTAELFNMIGRKCKENKLKFGYHNQSLDYLKKIL